MRYAFILLALLCSCQSEQSRAEWGKVLREAAERDVRAKTFEIDLDGGVHCWVYEGWRENSISCYRTDK